MPDTIRITRLARGSVPVTAAAVVVVAVVVVVVVVVIH
jgi:hypothetical protein